MAALVDMPWRDPARAGRVLRALSAALGDAFTPLSGELARLLPGNPDPDMALNNLERFLAAAPGSLPMLLAPPGTALETLLSLLGTSQFFADTLVADPDFLDMLRVPLRHTPGPESLQTELRREVQSASDDAGVLRAIRRFRRRHAIRIGTNDVIHDRTLEEITLDISDVADAVLVVALESARRTMSQRFGEPVREDGEPAQFVVLAFGKLGGRELNYSSDIDLMAVYDHDGVTRGRHAMTLDEFFSRVLSELVRLLTTHTDRGQAYRVDLRLRPEGKRGPLVRSLASTLDYYDNLGRTWERQALIKLRPVAGDLALGEEFLRRVEPFVYHHYLGFAEINDIKAMKRRIEVRAERAGLDDADVKTGRGGIRDIEFAVQFLQLLNAVDLHHLRERNTLRAMQALAAEGCLTAAEFTVLEDGYRFLRRVEHRLQLLLDLQTHRLPAHPDELQRLARRMGYRERAAPARAPAARRSFLDDAPPEVIDTRSLLIDPLDAFLHDCHEKTRLNRQVLDHLLHGTFADDAEEGSPETDLVLDPDPDPAMIESVLVRHRFKDVAAAYRNLTQLAQESVPFLSTPRCRHFLASIAPALLRELSRTPDPDQALNALERVTASLGAKAVLWELFRFSEPSLRLTVELCSGSEFLSDILVNNPGMVDDLLDSLVLNRPRSAEELSAELIELCRGAEDPSPILRSFRDKELLRVGMADLLGKTEIRETTAALSAVASTILARVAAIEAARLIETQGVPLLSDHAPARFVILGLGKLGGLELSYHSDLDLLLLYEGDGPTDNLAYFTELMRQIIRRLNHPDRLYAVDMRLRPTGGSGHLATPLAEFRRYHADGPAQRWERQALTRARLIHGDAAFGAEVMAAVREAVFRPRWHPECAAEIATMRDRMQASRGPRDLKRGPGGQVDVEFLVQMLQLKHGGQRPEVCQPNTWAALDALHHAGFLDDAEHRELLAGYNLFRRIESRLRITTNRALDEYPESLLEQEKLAQRLGMATAEELRATIDRHTHAVRSRFCERIRREMESPTEPS